MAANKELNRLKVILVEKKKSNLWLSKELGCSPTTVSKWCTNSSQPSVETLMEIARCLGVEVHELSLRRPKVRDLIAAGKKNISESEREVNLVANLAEVSPEIIQDLDLSDYMKIQDWLKDFLSISTEQR